jgi:hypothetical protein
VSALLHHVPDLNPFFRNEYICLVVAYIVDLTLILCDVFGSHGNVSPSGVQSVMNDFASSSPRTSIHAEICRFVKTVHQFEYQDNDPVLTKIIDLIRQNCDSSSVHGASGRPAFLTP